jgi:hypothetical protein
VAVIDPQRCPAAPEEVRESVLDVLAVETGHQPCPADPVTAPARDARQAGVTDRAPCPNVRAVEPARGVLREAVKAIDRDARREVEKATDPDVRLVVVIRTGRDVRRESGIRTGRP